MWVMSKYGFYSIVQKDDGIHIRSREIDSDPAQRRKPYHEVWAVRARALGAYGQKGDK